MAQNTTRVSIKQVAGPGPFGSNRSLSYLLDNTDGFQLDSSQFSQFAIASYSFDHMQKAYNRYSDPNKKDSLYLRNYKSKMPDADAYTKPGLDNNVYVLVAFGKHGEYFLIPDLNNNKDFRDDSVYQYRADAPAHDSLKTIVKELPVVKFWVNSWSKDHYVKNYLNIKLIPVHFTTLRSNRFTVAAEIQDHYEGEITVGGSSQKIWLRNDMPVDTRFFDRAALSIYLAKEDGATPDISHHFTAQDSLSMNQSMFVVDKVDPEGKYIELRITGSKTGLGVEVGDIARDFSSAEINTKNNITLSSLRKNYVLLDFWGTWCIPCKQILPTLQQLQKTYAARGLKMISVAFDEKKEDVKKYIRLEKITWFNLFQQQFANNAYPIIATYHIDNFPTLILIDPAGKIVFRDYGIPGAKNLVSFLQKELP